MNHLRAARQARGLSLRDLGDLVGVSGETVRLWELGRTRPYRANGRRLALALGDDLDHLLAPTPTNDGDGPKTIAA